VVVIQAPLVLENQPSRLGKCRFTRGSIGPWDPGKYTRASENFRCSPRRLAGRVGVHRDRHMDRRLPWPPSSAPVWAASLAHRMENPEPGSRTGMLIYHNQGPSGTEEIHQREERNHATQRHHDVEPRMRQTRRHTPRGREENARPRRRPAASLRRGRPLGRNDHRPRHRRASR